MIKRILSLQNVSLTRKYIYCLNIYSVKFIKSMSDITELEKFAISPNITQGQEDCENSTIVDTETEQQKKSNDDNPEKLSKRALKRLARKQVIEQKKKNKKEKKKNTEANSDKITQNQLQETTYYFENGLRKVYPYHFVFHTFAKGRWVGQKLLDVFLTEFRNDSKESYQKAFEDGKVSVNGETIGQDYVLKDNDYIENEVHRHELPVKDEDIQVIHEDDDVLVVNKPSSIPIHPCGRYRHNSLMYILAKEFNHFNLRTFYRIDRLTSGLMIFPKTEKKTAEFVDAVVKRTVKKTYICKVEGEFSENNVVCEEPLGQLDFQMGLHRVDQKGKHSKTTFERLSYDSMSNTSIVKCHPHTGRTHQIRVHLQWLGFPITNDPLYNSPVWGPEKGKYGKFGKSHQQLVAELKAHHSVENLSVPLEGTNRQSQRENEMFTQMDESRNPKRPRLDVKPNEDKPRFDPAKLTTDPKCNLCASNFPDPAPEKLVMYLHALNYKGDGWEFSTPMPSWTTEVNS